MDTTLLLLVTPLKEFHSKCLLSEDYECGDDDFDDNDDGDFDHGEDDVDHEDDDDDEDADDVVHPPPLRFSPHTVICPLCRLAFLQHYKSIRCQILSVVRKSFSQGKEENDGFCVNPLIEFPTTL